MKDYQVTLKIIDALADGQFHSGEQLGNMLGMSRAAVNQHLKILKEWGLEISRVTGKGYCLPEPLDLLNQQMITTTLQTPQVEVIPVIDSTNQYILNNIDRLNSGDACLAEYQQAGRGRRGRKWFSPFGTNLYLSMYWQLEQGPAAAMGLSLVIGIITAEVLKSQGCHDVRVKWPNDLYIKDQKVAGILVEMTGKTGDVAHVVIGAGINIAMRSVDPGVVNQDWTSLQQIGINLDRNLLASEIIKQLRLALHQFEEQGMPAFIERWNALDNFLGRPVKLLIGERVEHGIARGINEYGALMLEQDGAMQAWVGGEISLRAEG